MKTELDNKSIEKLFGEEHTYMLTNENTQLKRKALKDSAIIDDLKMKLASLEGKFK